MIFQYQELDVHIYGKSRCFHTACSEGKVLKDQQNFRNYFICYI